jgi:hypothetical protein
MKTFALTLFTTDGSLRSVVEVEEKIYGEGDNLPLLVNGRRVWPEKWSKFADTTFLINEKDGDFFAEAESLEELKGMYVEYFL